MYESKFPEVDDVVMVQVRRRRGARARRARKKKEKAAWRARARGSRRSRPPPPSPPPSPQVKSIAEMGAYVALLEYNGIEGMILLSELSRRRIRSITKLIKVGGGECWLARSFVCVRWDALLSRDPLAHRCVPRCGSCCCALAASAAPPTPPPLLTRAHALSLSPNTTRWAGKSP